MRRALLLVLVLVGPACGAPNPAGPGPITGISAMRPTRSVAGALNTNAVLVHERRPDEGDQ